LWLLDTSSWSNDLLKDNDLILDVDDDLYWYTYDQDQLNVTIDIWEIYRIHEDFAMTINQYGNWSNSQGLVSKLNGKWNRRRDLQMAPFNIVTLPSSPYLTEMIPLAGSDELYAMEGMFAEVFIALQVKLVFISEL
jgi:hypothetical protein